MVTAFDVLWPGTALMSPEMGSSLYLSHLGCRFTPAACEKCVSFKNSLLYACYSLGVKSAIQTYFGVDRKLYMAVVETGI